MQEKIKMYLEIENNIFDIKHQLLEYNQLLNSIKYIIGNNYNTNISYNHNYDFYHVISKINHKTITIDNTIAHLSASLGKITWILLPYSADFRWMENVTASLWYENAVLLRQTKNCNWESVLDIINTALSGKN